MSVHLGRSFKLLCPPVTKCLLCSSSLTLSSKPTQVVVHTLQGPEVYSKYLYRCRGCCLSHDKHAAHSAARQDVMYHHDRVSIRLDLKGRQTPGLTIPFLTLSSMGSARLLFHGGEGVQSARSLIELSRDLIRPFSGHHTTLYSVGVSYGASRKKIFKKS